MAYNNHPTKASRFNSQITGQWGPLFNIRCHLTSIGNLIVEIRPSYDYIISTMEFPTMVGWHLYIESGSWTYNQMLVSTVATDAVDALVLKSQSTTKPSASTLQTQWMLYHTMSIRCDYCKIFNIRHNKSQTLNVSQLGLQLSLHNSQVFSGEWRCSWSSAERRCSNYIWVINNFIAYSSASYIRDLMVLLIWIQVGPKSKSRKLKM